MGQTLRISARVPLLATQRILVECHTSLYQNQVFSEEAAQRQQLVIEARSWVGTLYRHRGRAKGKDGGIDCAQLVWICYLNCELAPELPLTEYSPDFFLHRGIEQYMDTVLTHCREIKYPQSGDIALFKVGRLFAHGGIVTQWPFIVHASRPAKCVLEERADMGWLSGRAVKFFSRW